CARVAAATRIAAHVGSPAEAGEPPPGDRRGISFAIHLQRGPNEQVYRILASELREDTVRSQAAVVPGEEHVRACAGVVRHPHLTPEADDTFHPAALDRRDERGVRVKNPVAADLAAQP